ncbi:MAG: helix-turn-helix transcriptional regulator, partial [Gammaproteobacteria bacterium]
MTSAVEPEVRDAAALNAALRHIRTRLGAPVVLGGPVRDERVQVTEVDGSRTTLLQGLQVGSGHGLGG